MRRWQLTNNNPLALYLSADARLSQTDYTDDQVWQLSLGSGDEAALALQTAYGGRVGRASLVPMWSVDGRVVFEAQAYHSPPILTAFAPGYLQAQAALLPEVHVTASYWATDSHTVMGSFTLSNMSAAALTVRLDLYAHAAKRERELQIAILTLVSEENALYFGRVGNIDPVVLMAGGRAGTDAAGHISPKVGQSLTVAAGSSATVRWATAGLPEMTNSIRRARYWLEQDADAYHQQVAAASAAIPSIQTGDTNRDATIAFAYQSAVGAFLRPAGVFPNPSFVTAREILHGYSAAGDGSDYPRAWSGQNPLAAYIIAPALASVAPALAEGVIRNCVHSASQDGFIDGLPGVNGDGRGLLALPILTRLAWAVYQGTGNRAFLVDVFPGLLAFFNRWFLDDCDRDADGLPEWAAPTQTGYTGWPLFTQGGVDITTVEGPGLAAYLLSEAQYLSRIALLLEDAEAVDGLQPRIAELTASLADLWSGDGFVYRDRDTHETPTRTLILDKVQADAEHLPALTLDAPARLVVEAVGGTSSKPRLSVDLHGLDGDGKPVTETLDADAFVWTYGRGAATSRTVFAQVDRVQANGLSRVFRLNAWTTGLNVVDMHTILPLMTGVLSDGQVAQVVEKLQAHLLVPNGLALFPKQTVPGGDESGVWVFWNALVCEALFSAGYTELAVDILRRLLRVQTATLRERGVFTTFYDEDDLRGMGTRLDLMGVVPLAMLMQSFGLAVRADGTVLVGEAFPWGEPVTVTQFGIRIERDAKTTHVTYPDGTTRTVPNGEPAELTPPADLTQPVSPPDLPAKPALLTAEPSPIPVKIEVEVEDAPSQV